MSPGALVILTMSVLVGALLLVAYARRYEADLRAVAHETPGGLDVEIVNVGFSNARRVRVSASEVRDRGRLVALAPPRALGTISRHDDPAQLHVDLRHRLRTVVAIELSWFDRTGPRRRRRRVDLPSSVRR